MVDFGYPLIWSEMYGSLQTILAKDVVGTIKLLNEEAQTELAEERADAFTVLGFPTGPEGPVGSIDKSKVLWGVYFESKAAYNKSAALKSKLTTFSKTGNIQQDMYGFIGLVLHLDSPDVRRGKTPTFAVLTSIKALNAEGAASIVDVQKRHGATMIKASAVPAYSNLLFLQPGFRLSLETEFAHQTQFRSSLSLRIASIFTR